MPKNQNEGVGGDLGRFTKAQRLLGDDGCWVDAESNLQLPYPALLGGRSRQGGPTSDG
ncbi:hypothetical protein ACIQNT_32265 [Streptomyces luteogriseus]|uniref:hypothetical protein n=1 Tax=Streptomyces luteogriseus TaxID=68233 RepID=UPI00381EB827